MRQLEPEERRPDERETDRGERQVFVDEEALSRWLRRPEDEPPQSSDDE